jgi:hypothetical protein
MEHIMDAFYPQVLIGPKELHATDHLALSFEGLPHHVSQLGVYTAGNITKSLKTSFRSSPAAASYYLYLLSI